VCGSAACGSPSGFDLCNAACDASEKCGYFTAAQQANCHTACSNNQGAASDKDNALSMMCKNAGDLRNQEIACVQASACGSNDVAYDVTLTSCGTTYDVGTGGFDETNNDSIITKNCVDAQ